MGPSHTVIRIDAGGAVHSFYLKLGSDLGLPQHPLAALHMCLRQDFGRGGRGGKRRGPDVDRAACQGRRWRGLGRAGTIVRICVCQNCEPPRSLCVARMPGRRGSPRGPSGETLGGHNFHFELDSAKKPNVRFYIKPPPPRPPSAACRPAPTPTVRRRRTDDAHLTDGRTRTRAR